MTKEYHTYSVRVENSSSVDKWLKKQKNSSASLKAIISVIANQYGIDDIFEALLKKHLEINTLDNANVDVSHLNEKDEKNTRNHNTDTRISNTYDKKDEVTPFMKSDDNFSYRDMM